MKKAAAVMCLTLLAGCAMTPRQKVIGAAVVTAIAVGVVAAHQRGHSNNQSLTLAPLPGAPCFVQRDGSCR
jgi:hypothetical protein